eukprot:1556759-Rhodomonas_salina.1
MFRQNQPQVRKTWLLVEEGDEQIETQNEQEFEARVRAELVQTLGDIELEGQEEARKRSLEALQRRMAAYTAKPCQTAQFNDKQHGLTLIDVTASELQEFPDRQIADFLIKRNEGMDIAPVLQNALKKIPGAVHSLVHVSLPPKAVAGDKCRFSRDGVSAAIFLTQKQLASGTLVFALHDKQQIRRVTGRTRSPHTLAAHARRTRSPQFLYKIQLHHPCS